MAPMWSEELTLRGAGGEPVDFQRTLLSHGVADLLPNRIAPDGSRLDTVLRTTVGPVAATLTRPAPDAATLTASGSRGEVVAQARFMLRLDEDLSGFYAVAQDDPDL